MLSLSSPRALTFLVSLVLVALALATLYTRVPVVGAYVASHRTWFFVGGYAVLALGVLLSGFDRVAHDEPAGYSGPCSLTTSARSPCSCPR